MIRVLWYCLFLFPIAAVAVWLVSTPGSFSAQWLGYQFEMNTSLAIVVFAMLLGAALLVSRWFGKAVRGPEAFAAYRREKRLAAGFEALSKGMVAVAAGDAAEVKKLSARAHKLLEQPALTRLLSAQAAQLEGKEDLAEEHYRDMLEVEETEFLGLRGLFGLSLRHGDHDAALDYAERAFKLRPSTPWVSAAMFELQSSRGEWAAAAETLEAAEKAKLIESDVAKRRRGVLYTEHARVADSKGETEVALDNATKALDLVPGFAPAADIAAKHLLAQEKSWKAAEVIETAWLVSPHPDLAVTYAKVKQGESRKAVAKWLRGLADFNKDDVESRLLRAAQYIELQHWKAARKALKGLTEHYPTVRVCQLMAEIERGENADTLQGEAAVRHWLARAVNAPRDAHWMCESCGREAHGWSATCPNCGAFDTLSWKAPKELSLEPLDVEDEPDIEDTPDLFGHAEAASTEPVDQVRIGPPPKSPEPYRPVHLRRLSDEKKESGDEEARDFTAPDDPGPGGEDPFDPETSREKETSW